MLKDRQGAAIVLDCFFTFFRFLCFFPWVLLPRVSEKCVWIILSVFQLPMTRVLFGEKKPKLTCKMMKKNGKEKEKHGKKMGNDWK